MAKSFIADTIGLKHLLSSIQNKERALPDFQRDFVWDASASEELLQSVLRNFPAGSLLEIQQDKNLFKPHAFAEAPEIPGDYVPPYLILDGQQRLTSLYQALYGKGRHRFYLDIGSLKTSATKIDPQTPLYEALDVEEALFHETLRTYKGKIVERDNWPLERQAEKLVLPISRIVGTPGGYEEWRDEVVEIRKKMKIYEDGDREILRRFGQELVYNLTDYHFPVVTLQSRTPTEAVCAIFETLNRTGVKLSAFDLLVASFYPKDIRLRDAWEEAKSDYPLLKEYSIDPYYLLQTVALRSERKGMGECKRGTVLKLEADDYRKYWKSTVDGLAEGLKCLRENCGVLTTHWLPYATFLVPFAALIADSKGSYRGHEIAGWKAKLQRWFWASTFAQSYEKAPNSTSKSHYVEMKRWLKENIRPQFIDDAKKALDSMDLQDVTPKQRARYRGFMCVILRRGIKDFYKAEAISPSKMFSGEVNDHHIFPQGVFGKGEWAEAINSIPNRTLIDERSNKIIQNKRPSAYIPILQKDCPPKLLDEIFSRHLIPIGEGSSTWNDDLQLFLKYRSEALLKEAKELIDGDSN